MERRRFLETLGTVSTVTFVGLAGCGSPGGGGETPGEGSPGVPNEDITPTGEGTPTEGGTPTDAETPAEETTPTEEGTPADEGTPTEEGSPAEEGTPTEEGTGTAEETGTPATGGEASVDMMTDGNEFIFDPVGLYVEPGTEVTWVNQSGGHSSTAYVEGNPQSETRRIPEDAEGWDSGFVSEEGAEFSHTFEVEGTYDYYCTPHKTQGMVARIVVGSPGGPAEGSTPPDGDVPESSAIVEQGTISYDDFQG